MLEKCIVQVDESQEVAHRREHALADMISSKVSLQFSMAQRATVKRIVSR